ncbi:hypothetical protein NBRC116592_30990 [Colwellia sp. KU-HH00111]|uniref:DEAD/DEAH box helicase n=1 Tax=Colwellia sp. KU-HH00111 TaxID=3127652 RepID=UPI00310490AA
MDLPKHIKSTKYYSKGLFEGLNSFKELELRIQKISIAKDKGDSFEVFAEAYIATEPTLQAEEVWSFENIPLKIKNLLNINTSNDKGIDGVYLNKLGQYSTYQVKFRSYRKSLTWDELSTFIGLSDSVKSKLIFTNSIRLPDDVLHQRSGLHCVRGSDLDYLKTDDFNRINNWLSKGITNRVIKKPRAHQQDAINNITNALQSTSRTTALMACGTGKSLVSLWVAEKLKPQSILVLLPSLALVRQILKEWCYETSLTNSSYICICSDNSVTKNIDAYTSDLSFPVTTDIDELASYLKNTVGTKIVFSTYQSAKVVSKAINNDFIFDFGVFDEAHKTAGREGKKFSFALKDENIKIQKRLFLTATPKHYSIRENNNYFKDIPVYSMDKEDVYGEVSYKLTFAEAANKGIICNYKVVVSVITNETVSRELLKRSGVDLGSDYVKAKQVANQLAIKECLEKYGVKKIFTFHKSIASAKSFTSEGDEGIAHHIPELETFHVNGDINAGSRENIINDFKNSDFALMSNARCLTEGVDVPTVDMVAFLSPKRSQVDVIQATGRAMRKSQNKDVGYILVPIFLELETGETVDEAIGKTEFNEVFDVLNALQEQDEQLYSSICNIREHSNDIKGFQDDRFNKTIEVLGPEIHLNDLKNAIKTKIVNKLAPAWYDRFAELKTFYNEYGHSDVPNDNENTRLASWVQYQRQQYKNEIPLLTIERIHKLETLNFKWDIASARWEDKFKQLEQYYNEFGNTTVHTRYDNGTLYNWMKTQIRDKKDNKLSEDRVNRLNALNFIWEPVSNREWDDKYDELAEYYNLNGTSLLPARYGSLGTWCVGQRQKYHQNELDEEQINKLDLIEFSWSPRGDLWTQRYNELVRFKNAKGHLCVDQYDEDYRQLATWVSSQRAKYKEYLQSRKWRNRIEKLEKLGFKWEGNNTSEKRDDKFLEMLEKLKQYEKKHGNTRVPAKWKQDRELGRWVDAQRQVFRKGNLPTYKKELLDEFNFNFLEQRNYYSFSERVAQLKDFKQKNGTAKFNMENDPYNLRGWIHRINKKFKNNLLEIEEIKELEDIGIDFSNNTSNMLQNKTYRENALRWDLRFKELQSYQQQYKNCNVPRNWQENTALSSWVNRQRRLFKNGSLDIESINKLEGIDFFFTRDKISANKIRQQKPKKERQQSNITTNNEVLWQYRFSELEEYFAKNGHCNIPRNWQENTALSSWVKTQRYNYKNDKLADHRKLKLEEINFSFVNQVIASWEERYAELVNYKEKFSLTEITTVDKKLPVLRSWLFNQLTKFRNKKLEDKQISLLKELGVVLSLHKKGDKWESKYNELIEFIKINGHCDVPQLYGGTTGLGKWVNRQRQSFKNNKLAIERVTKLDAVEFIWEKPMGQKSNPPIKIT